MAWFLHLSSVQVLPRFDLPLVSIGGLDHIDHFNCFSAENSQQVDTEKLLLYLRRECARHPQTPRPQLSATTKDLTQLPIRLKSA